jgi:hypothetical protein
VADNGYKLKGLRVNKRFIDRSDVDLRWEMEERFIRRPLVHVGHKNIAVSCAKNSENEDKSVWIIGF